MNSEERRAQRLARMVRARREELGLRQDQVGDRGGPSTTTLTKVENAVGIPANVTLRKLDAGLDWFPGSAHRILDGGDPLPASATVREMNEAGFTAVPASPPSSAEARRELLRKLDGGDVPPRTTHVSVVLAIAGELVTTATAIERLVEDDPELSSAVREHTKHLDDLAIRAAELALTLPRRSDGDDSVRRVDIAFSDDLEARRAAQAKAAEREWPAADPTELQRGPHADEDVDVTITISDWEASRSREDIEAAKRRAAEAVSAPDPENYQLLPRAGRKVRGPSEGQYVRDTQDRETEQGDEGGGVE